MKHPIILFQADKGDMFRAFLCLIFSCAIVAGYSAVGSLEKNPSEEKTFLHGKLSNGFTYYLHKTKLTPTLRISLIIKAGSVHENESEKGLCHLTEHMVSRSLKFRGIELADKNCPVWNMSQPFSSFEFTQFHFKIPSSLEKGLESCLLTLSDVSNNQPFKKSVLEEEKQEISDGLDQENITHMNLEKALMSLEYPAYQGRIPGDDQGICLNATLAQVQDFHTTWYQPDRMAIIVIGDIDVTATQSLIENLFGKITSSFSTSTSLPRETVTSHSSRALLYVDQNLQESRVFLSKPMPKMNPREALIFDIRIRLFQDYLESLVESKQLQFIDPFYELLPYPQVLRLIVTLPDDQYLEAFHDLSSFINYIVNSQSPFLDLITQKVLDQIKAEIRSGLENLQPEEIQHQLVTFYRDLFVKNHNFIQPCDVVEKIRMLDSISLQDVKDDIHKFHVFSKELLASPSVEVVKRCTGTKDIPENKGNDAQ